MASGQRAELLFDFVKNEEVDAVDNDLSDRAAAFDPPRPSPADGWSADGQIATDGVVAVSREIQVAGKTEAGRQ